MRAFVLWAVVERIANFPFGVPCVPCLHAPQKTGFDGQFSCNITWGYVAWMGGWGDRIPSGFGAGVGLSGLKIFSKFPETR